MLDLAQFDAAKRARSEQIFQQVAQRVDVRGVGAGRAFQRHNEVRSRVGCCRLKWRLRWRRSCTMFHGLLVFQCPGAATPGLTWWSDTNGLLGLSAANLPTP